MAIAHCHGQAFVAEQFRYGCDVNTGHNQVTGEGVTQVMKVQVSDPCRHITVMLFPLYGRPDLQARRIVLCRPWGSAGDPPHASHGQHQHRMHRIAVPGAAS